MPMDADGADRKINADRILHPEASTDKQQAAPLALVEDPNNSPYNREVAMKATLSAKSTVGDDVYSTCQRTTQQNQGGKQGVSPDRDRRNTTS